MTQIYSQELGRYQLDSLYTKFLQIRAPELLEQNIQHVTLSLEDRKCGFGILNEVKSHFDNFTFEQRQILKKILYRPSDMQKSIISPSGFFRIHFDTTNSNGNGIPSYVPGWSIDQNVSEVAKALDSAYNFEVNYIGFLPPPSDDVAGGDYRYDIYIINQSSQVYGYTEWENKVGPVNWTSFMVIDNDYSGYYSPGLDGMKVTVAHEFHHGIQVGSYAIYDANSPVRSADTFFYELTSTSMEEFVYDDVNDYYSYMHSYFNSTYKSFSDPTHSGYDMAIWNIYLVKIYDFQILKKQWELMPTQRAMYAISNSILDRNSNFAHDYNRFGIWTYYTGYRSIPNSPYFKEAENYPLIKPQSKISYPQYTYANVYAYAASNNFIQFGNTTNGDTLYAIVTNGDVSSLINDSSQTFPFTYTLFSDTLSGQRVLGDRYSANFEVANPVWWSVSEILNNILVREDSTQNSIIEDKEIFIFPNPCFYSKIPEGGISISFKTKVGEEADLNVYSVGMQLLFSSVLKTNPIITSDGKTFTGINWDGLDNNKNKLKSGVYICVIKIGEDVIKGKVVIFNE